MDERILLIGMMGSGKSTVAGILGRRLPALVVDTDEEVVAATGRTVAETFSELGEAEFRRLESVVVAGLSRRLPGSVVAVAGGAVLDPDNRARLKAAGRVVWLRALPETLALRVGASADRPLLAGSPDDRRLALSEIAASRAAIYAEVADVIVDVDGLSAEQVADAVVAALAGGRAAG